MKEKISNIIEFGFPLNSASQFKNEKFNIKLKDIEKILPQVKNEKEGISFIGDECKLTLNFKTKNKEVYFNYEFFVYERLDSKFIGCVLKKGNVFTLLNVFVKSENGPLNPKDLKPLIKGFNSGVSLKKMKISEGDFSIGNKVILPYLEYKDDVQFKNILSLIADEYNLKLHLLLN